MVFEFANLLLNHNFCLGSLWFIQNIQLIFLHFSNCSQRRMNQILSPVSFYTRFLLGCFDVSSVFCVFDFCVLRELSSSLIHNVNQLKSISGSFFFTKNRMKSALKLVSSSILNLNRGL